ncbi:MAG: hypothetical protein HOW73_27025 [Polyangiaceae bacterium]|nr:hypothetical protein [Polyangiaceae bacterium]
MKASFAYLAATMLTLVTSSAAAEDAPPAGSAVPPNDERYAQSASDSEPAPLIEESILPIAEPMPWLLPPIVVPPPIKKPKRVRNLPLTIVGSVLGGVGAMSVGLGAALFTREVTIIPRVVGFGMMIDGGVQLLAAIPLLAVGARPPSNGDTERLAPTAYSVQLGGNGATFSLAF